MTRRIRNKVWFAKHGPVKYVPCHWCNKLLSFDEATTEHLKEISVGGSIKNLSNLEIACQPCNFNHSRWLRELLFALDITIPRWSARLQYAKIRMNFLVGIDS